MLEFIQNLMENQYIRALVIAISFFVASKIITAIFDKYISKWTQKSHSKIDDLIVGKLKTPFTYVVVIFGLQIAIGQLDTGLLWLENLIRSILSLFFIYAAIVMVDAIFELWSEKFKAKNDNKTIDSIGPLFKKTVIVILSILNIIWILYIWGVDIGPFLASLGIAGFVIGFAMQDSLKNIFGGIALILDKTMSVGDKIILEGGELGIVDEVTIRSTKLKTFDNEIINIPNGRLSEMKIRNFTQPNLELRVVVDFSTAYGSDMDQVRDIITKTIHEIDNIMPEPEPSVVMTEMASSSLNWQARFWVSDQAIAYDQKILALEKIYKALNKNNINIPFPTRTIHLHKEE